MFFERIDIIWKFSLSICMLVICISSSSYASSEDSNLNSIIEKLLTPKSQQIIPNNNIKKIIPILIKESKTQSYLEEIDKLSINIKNSDDNILMGSKLLVPTLKEVWSSEFEDYINHGLLVDGENALKQLREASNLNEIEKEKIYSLFLGDYSSCSGKTYIDWVQLPESKTKKIEFQIGKVKRYFMTRVYPLRKYIIDDIEDINNSFSSAPKHKVEISRVFDLKENYLKTFKNKDTIGKTCFNNIQAFEFTAGDIEFKNNGQIHTHGKDLFLIANSINAEPNSEINLSPKDKPIQISFDKELIKSKLDHIARSKHGVTGLPGYTGYSSGNLFLDVKNKSKMPKIVVVGGQGGQGGNATNGRDSKAGKDGDEDLEKGTGIWSTYKKPNYINSGIFFLEDKNLKTKIIISCFVSGSNGKENNRRSHADYNGTDATPNGHGGYSGFGGMGGSSGNIYLIGEKNVNFQKIDADIGKFGSAGKIGNGGSGAKGGEGKHYIDLKKQCNCKLAGQNQLGWCSGYGIDGKTVKPALEGKNVVRGPLKSSAISKPIVLLKNNININIKQLNQLLNVADSALMDGTQKSYKLAEVIYNQVIQDIGEKTYNKAAKKIDEILTEKNNKSIEATRILSEIPKDEISTIVFKTEMGLWKIQNSHNYFGDKLNNVSTSTYTNLYKETQSVLEKYRRIFTERKRIINENNILQVRQNLESLRAEVDLLTSKELLYTKQLQIQRAEAVVGQTNERIDLAKENIKFDQDLKEVLASNQWADGSYDANPLAYGFANSLPYLANPGIATGSAVLGGFQGLERNKANKKAREAAHKQFHFQMQLNGIQAERAVVNSQSALAQLMFEKELGELGVEISERDLVLQEIIIESKQQYLDQLSKNNNILVQQLNDIAKLNEHLEVYHRILVKYLYDLRNTFQHKWKTLLPKNHKLMLVGFNKWEPDDFDRVLNEFDEANKDRQRSVGLVDLNSDDRFDRNLENGYLIIPFGDPKTDRKNPLDIGSNLNIDSFKRSGQVTFDLTFNDFRMNPFDKNGTRDNKVMLETTSFDVWFELDKENQKYNCQNIVEVPVTVSLGQTQYALDSRDAKTLIQFVTEDLSDKTDIGAPEKDRLIRDSANQACDYYTPCERWVDQQTNSTRSKRRDIDRFPYRSPLSTWTISLHESLLTRPTEVDTYLNCIKSMRFVLFYRYAKKDRN